MTSKTKSRNNEPLQTYPATTPEPRYFKGRGPEARANLNAFMELLRGLPRKGTTAAGTSARSLRLPDTAWDELERRAAELELPLHGLLRKLVAEFLYTQTTVPPRKPSAKSKASRRRRRELSRF